MWTVIGGGIGFIAGAALGMFMGHMIAGALLGMCVGIVAHRMTVKN